MSNSNRSSKSGAKRTSSQYSLGGALVTALLLLLYWWFNGGAPTGELPSNPPENPANAVTAAIAETATTAAIAANAQVTQGAVVTATAALTATALSEDATPTPLNTPPAATLEPTATAPPSPTATKPPKPTPSPTPTPSGPPGMAVITLDELPSEALETLALIEQGGPFPFDRDGISFQNRERLLPQKPRNYYREYTVITPGESDRGARRIVAGENGERYYSDDHYASFFWIVTE